jgi:hypothetical protein
MHIWVLAYLASSSNVPRQRFWIIIMSRICTSLLSNDTVKALSRNVHWKGTFLELSCMVQSLWYSQVPGGENYRVLQQMLQNYDHYAIQSRHNLEWSCVVFNQKIVLKYDIYRKRFHVLEGPEIRKWCLSILLWMCPRSLTDLSPSHTWAFFNKITYKYQGFRYFTHNAKNTLEMM